MLLKDRSIDDKQVTFDGETGRLEDVVRALRDRLASLTSIQRAARMLLEGSPYRVGKCASWLELEEAMLAQGWTHDEMLHAFVRSSVAYKIVPALQVFLRVLDRVERADLVELADLFEPSQQRFMTSLQQLVVVGIARKAPLEERFDRFMLYNASWDLLAEHLEALPVPRRRPLLEEMLVDPSSGTNALFRVRRGLRLMSMLDESQRVRLEARLEALPGMKDARLKPDVLARLRERFSNGGGPPATEIRGSDGYTPETRNAVEYWKEKIAEQRMVGRIGPLAALRLDVSIRVDAPELADVASWGRATQPRQLEIAAAVEVAASDFDLRFESLQTFGSVPIACFVHGATELSMCLVPGGSYTRGFSEREEGVIRAELDKTQSDEFGAHQELRYLLDGIAEMRPTQRVVVRPFLVFQSPSKPRNPAEVAALFEEIPFRLLTEAEHEYAQRGGVESSLTWRGDEVPDGVWLGEAGNPQLVNGFGLSQFGPNPEVLADVWHVDHEGAPLDGSARIGDGPRVVRGGAAMLYPWQGCAEWHMLINAARGHSDDWEYFLSIRPALGIEIAEPES